MCLLLLVPVPVLQMHFLEEGIFLVLAISKVLGGLISLNGIVGGLPQVDVDKEGMYQGDQEGLSVTSPN